MIEIWKDIKGLEGCYKISNLGKIKSLKDNHGNSREKILKPNLDGFGYKKVTVYKNKKKLTRKIHILVAQTFIDNKNNLPEVNHKDECKTNNIVDNLEWCTYKYNINYGTRNERMALAQSKPIIGISIKDNSILRFNSSMEAQRNGFSQGNISMCLNKIRNSHKGYKWIYEGEVI